MESEGRAFLLRSDVESDVVYNEVVAVLRRQFLKAEENLVSVGAEFDSCAICQHAISLFRKHRLSRSDRELVLNYEDYLVAVQLCLAEINKQKIGDFDVEVSRVMEVSKLITKFKLRAVTGDSVSHLEEDDQFQKTLKAYDEYLKKCNVVDTVDVFLRLFDAYNSGQAELKSEIDQTSLLFTNAPATPIESEICKFLLQSKTVHSVHVQHPLDENTVVGNTDVTLTETSFLEGCEQFEKVTHNSSQRSSLTELYLEQIFNGYLQLIVNSRNEIALSRVINVPDRGLEHQAFTDLRHAAKLTGLSLLQTAVSYVMRIRLGGKSYAPESNNTLSSHVKGLSEFTDLYHKMQNYIEEDPNPRTAVKRVINLIRNVILKDNLLRKQSVENIAEKLQSAASATVEAVEKSVDESPKRAVGAGGSVLGLKTVKVLRQMMDRSAGSPTSVRCVDILSDATSSQKTPLRFPSILSKFRSPVEVESSPDYDLKKSLGDRMRERMDQQQKKQVQVPRFKACMDWAGPSDYESSKVEEVCTLHDCIPSKSLVQSAKTKTVRRVLESVNDQENITADEVPADLLGDAPQEKPTGKRAPKSQLADKPAKRQKQNKLIASKKKTIPLQKGQKQLTAFFRM